MQGVRALLARRTSITTPAQIRKLSAEAGARERILPDDDPSKPTKKIASTIKTFSKDVHAINKFSNFHVLIAVVAVGVYGIFYKDQDQAREAASPATVEEADETG